MTKSVTGKKLLGEYVTMLSANLAVFFLVTDTASAGTAGFTFLLPFAVTAVIAAIMNTVRVTFFLDLAEPGEGNPGDDNDEKQFTRGWLRWMAGRIEAVRRKFVTAGAFRHGEGAK